MRKRFDLQNFLIDKVEVKNVATMDVAVGVCGFDVFPVAELMVGTIVEVLPLLY